jgi:flavin-dependent dehydrogenase
MPDAHADERCDVVVIGAGVAGCAAAIGLARAGVSVALIEAKPFPRAKVCGEFVSPSATAALEELLPAEALRETGARRVGEVVLERGKRAAGYDLPSPAWVLSRRALDAALVEEAKSAGVRVLQPASVRSVAYHDTRAAVALSRRGDNDATIACSLVVHADGSGRFDAVEGQQARAVRKRPGVVGLKCHLKHDAARFAARPGALRMRAALRKGGLAGAYIGYVPVEAGEATVAMVVRSDVVSRYAGLTGGIAGAGGDALLADAWPTLAGATRCSPWLACPVAGSWYVCGAHTRSIRVGNAAAAVEPVGGEGIGLAIRGGLDIARAVGDARAAGGSLDDLPTLRHIADGVRTSYRKRLIVRRPACAFAAWLLEKPSASGALWPLVATPGLGASVVKGWCRATGKAASPKPA